MFPFDMIPETIDPKIRKIITVLVIVQFVAFLTLIIILTYEHISKKKEYKEKKMNDNKNGENENTKKKNE